MVRSKREVSVANVVRLSDVRRSFGKVVALDALSLTVQQGEIYGLLGRNGAGKTTTMRLLIGLLQADAGEVALFGQPVRRVTPELKRSIGYVSQEQVFYAWMTAVDLGRFVGGFYPTWDDAHFRALLKNLDVPPDRRSAEMSGGTRTKLGLALALASRPKLLLLDEPTAGLDPVARREFADQVASAAKQLGTTVLFSTHLVDEVERLAERLGVIQAGQTRYEGRVHDLLAEVRRVTGITELPPGFVRVRGDVWRAPEAAWAGLPAHARAEAMPLEEVFLAMARTDAVGA